MLGRGAGLHEGLLLWMWMHRLLLSLHLIVAEMVVEREASLVLVDLLQGSRIAACWMTCAEMRWWHLQKKVERTFNGTFGAIANVLGSLLLTLNKARKSIIWVSCRIKVKWKFSLEWGSGKTKQQLKINNHDDVTEMRLNNFFLLVVWLNDTMR